MTKLRIAILRRQCDAEAGGEGEVCYFRRVVQKETAWTELGDLEAHHPGALSWVVTILYPEHVMFLVARLTISFPRFVLLQDACRR